MRRVGKVTTEWLRVRREWIKLHPPIDLTASEGYYEPMTIKQIETFARKFIVNPNNGCWEWQNALQAGYGSHTVKGKEQRAHRVSYKLAYGEIPEGMVIDHLCRNKRCVNPKHLEAVTQHENILRGTSPQAHYAKRTHCNNGHPFSKDNTLIRENGSRRCKACHKDYHSYYRRKNRELLRLKAYQYR